MSLQEAIATAASGAPVPEPVLTRAFSEIVSGEASAVRIAALLVALSPWHLYWSQNARFYTLTQALSVLGGGLWLRGLFDASRKETLAGLVLLGFAALTHPSAALLAGSLLAAPWVLRGLGYFPDAYEHPATWRLLGRIAVVVLLIPLGQHEFLIRLQHREFLDLRQVPRQSGFAGGDGGQVGLGH